MTIAILTNMFKGGPDGTIDSDLLKLNDSHFVVNSNKQLEFHSSAVVSDQVSNNAIPATGGSTTLAPSVNATRRAITQLGTQGRLLPEADGAANTVLLGDKTFGTPPSRFQRTELAFGDIIVGTNWISYPTTDTQISERVMFSSTNYNISEWDDIEMYVSSNAETSQRVFLVQRINPALIPTAVHTNGPTWQWSVNQFNNGTIQYDTNANENHIRFAKSGNKIVMMVVRIVETHHLFESQNQADRGLHCGIYGIRY